MVKEDQQQEIEAKKEGQDVLQGQLGNMLSGVERTLAVTCESIMDKMKQLETKIQDMEKRYSELAKDAEQAIKSSDVGEANKETKPEAGDQNS